MAFARLIQPTPDRCHRFGILVKPRFALRNHAREPDYHRIVTLLFDDHGAVSEIRPERYAALGIGGFVAGRGSHSTTIT